MCLASLRARLSQSASLGSSILLFERVVIYIFQSTSGEHIARNDAMDSVVEHPTTTWEAMPEGNVFYRRLQLYSIPGKLPDLSDFIIAGCRNGGPIGACTRLQQASDVRADSAHLPCSAYARYVKNNRYQSRWSCFLEVSDSSVFFRGRGVTVTQCEHSISPTLWVTMSTN